MPAPPAPSARAYVSPRSLNVHAADPIDLHQLAAELARPVALGYLSASIALGVLTMHAVRRDRENQLAGPAHLQGLRTRLAWTMAERTRRLCRTRERLAAWEIPRAIAIAIERRAKRSEIVAVAEQINAANERLLKPSEIDDICAAEVVQRSRGRPPAMAPRRGQRR